VTEYGGFWRRFAAYFIDSIILQIAMSIVGAVFGVSLGINGMTGNADVANAAALGMVGTVWIISFVGTWLYFALLESSSMQATLGKLALGVIVTDLNGDRISFARATGRYFAKIVSTIILFIGFIMAAFTERRQGLHDLMAGTLVYKTRDPRSVRSPAGIFE
jgi:uncharacterized RDD family membrane protein YckC